MAEAEGKPLAGEAARQTQEKAGGEIEQKGPAVSSPAEPERRQDQEAVAGEEAKRPDQKEAQDPPVVKIRLQKAEGKTPKAAVETKDAQKAQAKAGGEAERKAREAPFHAERDRRDREAAAGTKTAEQRIFGELEDVVDGLEWRLQASNRERLTLLELAREIQKAYDVRLEDLEALKEELQDARETGEAFRKRASELEASVADALHKSQGLEAALQSAQEERKSLEQRLGELEALKREHQEALDAAEKSRNQLESLEQRLAGMDAELSAAQRKSSDLEARLQEAEAVKEKARELETALEDAEKSREAAQRKYQLVGDELQE
ncbi:MAG: hypothetical protein LBP61_05685, partial [Desulfovibrio sp.]|nr:hypothetical protein [Desulfovibrio sp.]